MKKAPKQARIPLVYVTSRGNRDGRPVPSAAQLADMGYKAAIDALTYLLSESPISPGSPTPRSAHGRLHRPSHRAVRRRAPGTSRHLIGLDDFYEIEEQTVEKRKWGSR